MTLADDAHPSRLCANQAATAGHSQAENAALAPMAHVQETGDILIARDPYGSRVLLTADFILHFPEDPANSPTQPHCYAWDIDWRAQVGPAADEAALTIPRPLEFLRLLQPALAIGTLLDPGITGDEPREVMREYYRLHARAVAAAAHFKDKVDKARQPPDPDETEEELTEAFLAWHSANADPNAPAARSRAAARSHSALTNPFRGPAHEVTPTTARSDPLYPRGNVYSQYGRSDYISSHSRGYGEPRDPHGRRHQPHPRDPARTGNRRAQ